MCGLFGLVKSSIFTETDKENFKKASFLSSVRGIDSTGYLRIAGVLNTKPAYANFIKSARDPISFSKLPEVREFIRPPNIYALLGHTRSATKGSVSTNNAHPFVSKCGRFTVFHNGTLHNTHTGYETDSEWLTNKIAEAGGNLEEVLPDVNGAYCLVIWDAQERAVSLIRNSQRPLHYINRGKWLFAYASEKWMLNSAYNALDADIKELPVHKMITLKYDERLDFETTEVEVKATKPFQGYVYGAYRGPSWDSDYAPWWEERLQKELSDEANEQLILPRKSSGQTKEPVVYGALVPVGETKGNATTGNLNPSLFEQKTEKKDGKSSQRKGGKTTNVVPFRNGNIIRSRLTNSGDRVTEFYLLQSGFSPEDIKVIMDAPEEMDIDTESIADMIENGIMNFGEDYIPKPEELNPFVTFFLSKNRAVTLQAFKNLVNCGCGVCGRDFAYDEHRNWSDQPGSHFSCFGDCTPIKNVTVN